MQDWKNADAYPKKLSRTGWAWEFLRRNEEYRNDYARFSELKVEIELHHGPVETWTPDLLADVPDAWHYSPPKLAAESKHEWLCRVAISLDARNPRRQLIHIGYAARWRLAAMADPEKDVTQGVQFLPAMSRPPVWYSVDGVEGKSFGSLGDPLPTEAFTRIDLTRSVASQLEQVRKLLIAEQRRLKKEGLVWRSAIHPRKLSTYLRVVDAFAGKAKTKEIAEIIFRRIPSVDPSYHGQARVREAYKQGMALVNGGYLNILKQSR